MWMNTIRVRGARSHNLRNIDLDLPRGRLIVITGPSGSGKSSLAFDTLYAEGQRRYVESLSAYARQFLPRMDRPDVDSIDGLSPAIAIRQTRTVANPRSTVGTVTEIHDHLRLLFARAGQPYCPDHPDIPLSAQSVTQMVDAAMMRPAGTMLHVLAPLREDGREPIAARIDDLRARGFIRFRVDGSIVDADHMVAAAANPGANPGTIPQTPAQRLEVVVDRLRVNLQSRSRLAESLETALQISDGTVLLVEPETGTETRLSSRHACTRCGYTAPTLEPRLFSFNSPAGACPRCDGLGVVTDDETAIHAAVDAAADHAATSGLPPGLRPEVLPSVRPGVRPGFCPDCGGTRLRREARFVFVGEGAQRRAIHEIEAMPVAQDCAYFATLAIPGPRHAVGSRIVGEILLRVRLLDEIGLGYLTLARSAGTLSGGEAQRIHLASQVGAGLAGVLYVLDEPSIGLHPRDNARLIQTLVRLRDLDNTVLVVEHDEDTMRAADHLVDMGPGAGALGGLVVAQGTPAEVAANPLSLTGDYLAGRRSISVPVQRRPAGPHWLRLRGAHGNNLRGIDLEVPLGCLVSVTGVSGSGKSTLVLDTLVPALARGGAAGRVAGSVAEAAAASYDALEGADRIDRVVTVDQAPIGRSPRSNPATYTGIFGAVRELFAATVTARSRGYDAGRFSFNVPGGRCEECQGEGVITVAMHFLPDMTVPCEVCGGSRYNRETLDVLYKGRNIAEVLDCTADQALECFGAVPALERRLRTLTEVGLGYLRLGQSATTLSGGEAQRIKLSQELSRRDPGRTLYVLDEPTTGLHFHDIATLIEVLRQLRDQGNTVLTVEHNLDVIKCADWVIDLGPEGGEGGGTIVAAGTPEQVATAAASHTAPHLRNALAAQARRMVDIEAGTDAQSKISATTSSASPRSPRHSNRSRDAA